MSTEPQFKAGNIVLLKSGGPAMTVYRVHPNGQTVEACWFNDREYRNACFQPVELIKAAE